MDATSVEDGLEKKHYVEASQILNL